MLSDLFDRFSELFDNIRVEPTQSSIKTLEKELIFRRIDPSYKSMLTLKYLTKQLLRDEYLKPNNEEVMRNVHVVDEEGQLNKCIVVVDDPLNVSFLAASSYTLVIVTLSDSPVVIPNFDDKVPEFVYDHSWTVINPLYSLISSVLWFVKQQLIFEGRGAHDTPASPRFSMFYHQVKQKLFDETVINQWYYVRALFKLLALLETYLDEVESESLYKLCSSLDFNNPVDTAQKLYQNTLFAGFDYVDEIDVKDADVEQDEDVEFVLNWMYSYEYNGKEREWELEVSTCKNEGCSNQVIFGGPYCRSHLRNVLHLNILPTENNERVEVYEDGVYTHKYEFKVGAVILTLDEPTVSTAVFRKNYYSDITTYLPYSIQVSPGQWIDGSKKRHVLFMIRHSEEANVAISMENGKIVLKATKTISSNQELFRAHAEWDKHEEVDYNTFLGSNPKESLEDEYNFITDSVEDSRFTDDDVFNAVQLLNRPEDLEDFKRSLQKMRPSSEIQDQLQQVDLQLDVLKSPDMQSLIQKLS